jgi:hypothetical protein
MPILLPAQLFNLLVVLLNISAQGCGQTHQGVGPITALAYVLTLENAQRFAKSRDVGPYLGLVPKQEDSGESQPKLGISKAGDTMVRKLLVGSAQYILGRLDRTRTYDDMGCGSVSGVGRMRRSEQR